MRGPNITISRHSDQGVYGVVIETPSQAPILLETEGCDSSREAALARSRRAFGSQPNRWCVVRLVPVDGNELLLLDMQRLQPKETEE